METSSGASGSDPTGQPALPDEAHRRHPFSRAREKGWRRCASSGSAGCPVGSDPDAPEDVSMLTARGSQLLVAVIALSCTLGGCGGAQSRYESHMKRGQAYLDQGDYSKANVEFRNALQI